MERAGEEARGRRVSGEEDRAMGVAEFEGDEEPVAIQEGCDLDGLAENLKGSRSCCDVGAWGIRGG
jgi:hypothetical protein